MDPLWCCLAANRKLGETRSRSALQQIILDEFESSSESSDEQDAAPFAPRARKTFPGGRGTGRPNRKKPRPYLEDGDGNTVARRHLQVGMAGPWGPRFFAHPLRPGSGQWDTFRSKLRLPFPLFNMAKEDCLKDGVFKTEAPEGHTSGGHTPSPIELKMAAYWRYLATGAQVDAHEEGSGCARTTLQEFFTPFGEWFVAKYFDEWIRWPTTEEELMYLKS